MSLDALTGNNRFNPGDMAYLFVSQSNDVLYPFSITRRLPANSEHADFTIMLRAKVIEQRGEALDLEFDFDRASPPQAFLAHVAQAPQDQLHLELAVSPDGRATIAAFHAGNQIYNQRVITKSVLPGRSIEIAASAPPT